MKIPVQCMTDRFTDLVDQDNLGSPIEREFYQAISKYLGRGTELRNQFPAKAREYNFAIDFVIISPREKIGIECDGKDFHNPTKDAWRDGLILNAGIVNAILRFRGSDINFRIHDALYAMAAWYPDIFSDRGLDNIGRLATEMARNSEIGQEQAHYFYRPTEEADSLEDPVDDRFCEGFGELHLYRRRRTDQR